MMAKKIKATKAAAGVAVTYAIDELGWVRAVAEAAIADPVFDDTYLVKLAVGETKNLDHDTRTLTLLVGGETVINEGDEQLWEDNATDQ